MWRGTLAKQMGSGKVDGPEEKDHKERERPRERKTRFEGQISAWRGSFGACIDNFLQDNSDFAEPQKGRGLCPMP